METYKPNSHKYKEEQTKPEKKVEKIITGLAKTRKKNQVQKLAGALLSEDVDSVKSYILLDVLVPAIKKAISDIVTNGIDMLLYGESRGDKKTPASKVSYRSYYDKPDDRRKDVGARSRAVYSYDDIVLDTRGEAESVLASMDELMSMYGVISVADFYDLVGVTGNYTDDKYGWTNIRSASVVRVRDGYLIKLPKAVPLNY